MISARARFLATPLVVASLNLYGCAAFAGSAGNAAPSAAPPQSVKPETATAAHYWYDGERRRAVRVDRDWIADFRTGERKDGTPLKRADSDEKASASIGEGVSEVLRDESGTLRALPGGVIVRLSESDARRARDALADAGVSPVRALDPEQRTWLVESPAGLASLELANRLHESGRFESVTPNWWRPRRLK